jgi:GNAT superfamily N-acetyltransferase
LTAADPVSDHAAIDEGARPAQPTDLPRLAELVREAIEELAPSRGGWVWARREAPQEPVEALLAARLGDATSVLLCGTIGVVVGGLASGRLERLSDGSVMAALDGIYVEAPFRELGVGEALMDALVGWALDNGAVGIDAIVLPGNRAAKNFFEAHGLVARAIVVHRRLDHQ